MVAAEAGGADRMQFHHETARGEDPGSVASPDRDRVVEGAAAVEPGPRAAES